MTDDRIDRELAERLRAYESRMPATAPPPVEAVGSSRLRPIIGVGALAAIATVLLLAVLIRGSADENVGDASGSPVPSASVRTSEPAPSMTPEAPASSSPTSTPQPTGAPSGTPAAGTTDLVWTTTRSEPASGGLSMADAVTLLGDRYVAVGVEFDQPLPNFGPTPPHRARVWTSRDGRSWDAVDLGPGFDNVRLGTPFVRPDGSLLSIGARGVVSEFGIAEPETAAWTTTDGLTWTEIDPPLEGFLVSTIEQGARGMLAAVRPSSSSDVHELWLSTDGQAWVRVHSLEANYIDIGAGDEGFAAVGWIGDDDGRPISIASADGRTWIDGRPPAFSPYLEVASLGGDWVVVDDPGGTAPTWFSANGLDWAARGEIPVRTIPLSGAECREYRDQLMSTGPWLVTSTELSYPCSEGGYTVHGTQYLSIDGAAWTALPFAEGTVGENRSGSRVNDALATRDGLILVGEENGAAVFWFGEEP